MRWLLGPLAVLVALGAPVLVLLAGRSTNGEEKPHLRPVGCPWKRHQSPSVAMRALADQGFGSQAWPGACWRPYSTDSPLNKPIPANPRLHSNSAAIVGRLVSQNPFGQVSAGTAEQENDYGRPVYYARWSDPVQTVDCTTYCGRATDGARIPMPAGALPAAGVDHHMTVVLPDGVEWDFWHATPPSNGTITAAAVKLNRLHGPGTRSGADAANFALLGGLVRAQELRAGLIDHAMVGDVPCTNGANVWPSVGGAGSRCSDTTNAPAMGMRFQLDPAYMTNARLATYPPWKQVILRAYRDYGFYVEDTNCPGCVWGAPFKESGTQYTSLGVEDPTEAWARDAYNAGQNDIDKDNGDYVLHLERNVDWSRLRIIDPCVSRGTC